MIYSPVGRLMRMYLGLVHHHQICKNAEDAETVTRQRLDQRMTHLRVPLQILFFGSPTQDVDGNDLETSSDIESPTSNAYDDLFSGGNTDSGPFGTGAPPPGMVRRKRRQNRSPPTSPPEI
mmetsp:Transcript_9708/g.11172  ORF Transcript_9708/g.11172 Transcript_9708/m.11172 type:complete len:121 (-) Transcript_9708:128-490(-)